MSIDELKSQAFAGEDVQWQMLWINKNQRHQIEAILGRSFKSLRVRYLGGGSKTLWVFEEIGKELPITVGVVVDNGKITQVEVMEYRESRGGEVRYPFFTQQFQGLGLASAEQAKLDGSIDGITGATLSVRALKKIATLALFCHQLTPFAHVQNNQLSNL
ncbi:hypothetical protein GCM10027217_31150 [Pseudomaricurvus hydrocarbonicus]